MSVEVTQADREAVALIYENMSQPGDWKPEGARQGNMDDLPTVQAFARHRIEAERGALERAAQAVLDHRYGDSFLDSCGLRKEHRQDIAARVRSLMGEGE